MCRGQYQTREELLEAFEKEAVPHMKTLFRVAMYLEDDRDKAGELVQETFALALQSFHLFEPGRNSCVWLVALMYSVKRRQHHKVSTFH